MREYNFDKYEKYLKNAGKIKQLEEENAKFLDEFNIFHEEFRFYFDEKDEAILDGFFNGLTIQQIVDKMGVTRRTFYDRKEKIEEILERFKIGEK